MESIRNIKVLTNKIEASDFEAYSPIGRQNDYLFILFQSNFLFSYDGKDYFKMGKNSVIVFAPFQIHAYKSDDKQFVNSFLAFQCDNSYVEQFSFPLHSIFKVTDEDARQILALLDRMSFILNTDYDLNARKNLPKMLDDLFKFIGRIYNNSLSNAADANPKFALFSNARNLMIEDPVNITVKEMVNRLGYSSNYFRIMYKRFFGIAPIKDRNEHLLHVIRDYLQTTNFTLETISELCNIYSVPYLINLFKAHEGLTPHQYRLRNQKNTNAN